MKTKVLFMASMAILGATALKAQLNVGSTSGPHASAILQATSTSKGFLPPSMTTLQRNAISSPALGLLIYNTDLKRAEIFSDLSGTAAWGAATAELYTADGTLTTSRIVTLGTNSLTFQGSSAGAVNFVNTTAGSGKLLSSFGTPAVQRIQLFDENTATTEGAYIKFTGGSVAQIKSEANIALMPFAGVGINTTAPTTTLDVNGSLRIRTLATGTGTSMLTTDNNGNVSKQILQPVIYGTGGQNAIDGVTIGSTTTTSQYTGWTITIPANSKYLVRISMLISKNGSYTNGSSLWLRSGFSTTQPTFTNSTYVVANTPSKVVGLANANDNFQMILGSLAVNNTTAAPLVLYYFFDLPGMSGGYTGNIATGKSFASASENSMIATPIF